MAEITTEFLESIKVNQNFALGVNFEKKSTFEAKKPNNQFFFRVHPEEEYRFCTNLLEYNEKYFFVAPALHEECFRELRITTLYLTQTRQGSTMVWPVKGQASNAELNSWPLSAHAAALEATKNWIRLSSNREAKAYEIILANDNSLKPNWPKQTMNEILKIAFQGRFIDDSNHLVLRSLRGEV